MGLSNKLSTIASLLRQRGLLSTINVALKKLFPSGNFLLSWDERLLLRCSVANQAGGSGKGVKLPAAEAGLLEGVNNMSGRAIEAAIARGESCWVVRQNDEVIAHVWISSARPQITSDTGYRLNIGGDFAYWWRDIYVHPEWRGTGLPAVLFNAWLASLQADQIADIYTEVESGNAASVRAHEKLGFRQIASLHMFCLLGARFFYLRGEGVPAFVFRFLPRNVHYSASSE